MMKIAFVEPRKSLAGAEAVVFLVPANSSLTFTLHQRALLPSKGERQIKRFLERRGFEGSIKELCYSSEEGTLFVFAGLGKTSEITLEHIRRSVNAARGLLAQLKVQEAVFMLPYEILSFPQDRVAEAAAEALWLGEYTFDKYQTKKKSKPMKSVTVTVPSVSGSLNRRLRELKVISQSVNRARDLANDNSDEVTPANFGLAAETSAKQLGLKITMLKEQALAKQGMGLLYNVGRGSVHPPRLVLLEYRGNPDSKDVTAIVGKGITFDTGGVNLKPSEGSMIDHMHLDMSGAAAILGTMEALAELKWPVNVVGVMALAENAIDGNSYKPGCVLRAYDGTTVEVANTDAEGRLVLGDAVAYTVANIHPTRIIDLATLTGAVIVALGHRYAGLVSTDDGLAEQLTAAGEETGEVVWRMPMNADYKEDIKSDKAEIKNLGEGRSAGTIAGAVFIEHFTKKTPWAHVDIAGTAMLPKPRDYHPKGGTGFGVRLLMEYFRRLKI